MHTEKVTIEKIAKYIIAVVKSVNKSKEYALDIVCWYTINDKETKEVADYINKHF